MSTDIGTPDRSLVELLLSLSEDLSKVKTLEDVNQLIPQRAECLKLAVWMRCASAALIQLHDIPEYQIREQLAIRGLLR